MAGGALGRGVGLGGSRVVEFHRNVIVGPNRAIKLQRVFETEQAGPVTDPPSLEAPGLRSLAVGHSRLQCPSKVAIPSQRLVPGVQKFPNRSHVGSY